jgi:hypothetical protein
MEAHLRAAGWSPYRRAGALDLARWRDLHLDHALPLVRSFERFMAAFGGLAVPALEANGRLQWFEPDLSAFTVDELAELADEVGTPVNGIGRHAYHVPLLLGEDDRVFGYDERVVLWGRDPHEAIERISRGHGSIFTRP